MLIYIPVLGRQLDNPISVPGLQGMAVPKYLGTAVGFRATERLLSF